MNMSIYKVKAQLFHLLSHPVRLQILNELRISRACVCHLQVITNRPQAYISQQLRVLREAGLVEDEKDGQNVYYYLRSDKVRILLQETLGESGPHQIIGDCTCPLCQEKDPEK